VQKKFDKRKISNALRLKSLKDAEDVLREIARRSKPIFCDSEFIEQSAFINDPSRLKAAITTRRAGKSYAAGLYLFKEAMQTPMVNCLYLALTRDSAKRIMWNDIVKRIAKRYSLNCKFNETTLTVTLPTGSMIYLAGADAKPDEMEKFLGSKYKLIVIDEAGSFKQDLRRLVYSILRPTTVDNQGTICLIGTPSSVFKGLFYEVTTGIEPGWSMHRWSAYNNPYIKDAWDLEIKELLQKNPSIVDTPLYKLMYLGQWYIDTSKMVYKFDPKRDIYVSLNANREYEYVMGVDLGYEDPTAFTVCAFNKYDPVLYVVESFSKQHMTIHDVAVQIKELQTKYKTYKTVVDNANKQAVEEIKQRYAIPLTPADKTGKVDFIEIMNAEFIQGKIKIHESCTSLIEEYSELVWDDKADKRVEHPLCKNDKADATLYAWRYCYNYAWQLKPERIVPQSERAVDAFWEAEERKHNRPLWETDLFDISR
jgi:PBSX family phage terminase large subunit